MAWFKNSPVSHTYHWAGSKINDVAESISDGVTHHVFRRKDDINFHPTLLSKTGKAQEIPLEDLVLVSYSQQAIYDTFSDLSPTEQYKVRWVDEHRDRCKGALHFRRHVGARAVVATCFAHGISQNVESGHTTNFINFLTIYPETILEIVPKFKVGDKITFALVRAVALSILAGEPDRTIRDGGASLAVMIGTMLKSNPDMRAYMRDMRDPKGLDKDMTEKLAKARQHLREASDLASYSVKKLFLDKIPTEMIHESQTVLVRQKIEGHLALASRAILNHSDALLFAKNAYEGNTPLEKIFALFGSILRDCRDSRLAYGYLMAGVKLYAQSKEDDYHRTGNTAKIILGLAGAAVSAFPVAAPGAAAAVVVGCAIVDHAVDQKCKTLDTYVDHLAGRVSDSFGVSDAVFNTAYQTAAARGRNII